MIALPLRCTRRKPSGFSDTSHYESECTVVAFIYGKDVDAYGYGRGGETLLCVFVDEYGSFTSAPANQFVVLKEQK